MGSGEHFHKSRGLVSRRHYFSFDTTVAVTTESKYKGDLTVGRVGERYPRPTRLAHLRVTAVQ